MIKMIEEYLKAEGSDPTYAKDSYDYYKKHNLLWTLMYVIEHKIELFSFDEWTQLHMFSGDNTIPYEAREIVCDILLRETGDWHILDYDPDKKEDRELILPMIEEYKQKSLVRIDNSAFWNKDKSEV